MGSRRDLGADVLVLVGAVERDRLLEAVPQTHAWRPPRPLPKLRRIGIEAADVDAFLVRWPLHVTHTPRSGDVDQHRHEIAEAHGRFAADVEDFAVTRVSGAGTQK